MIRLTVGDCKTGDVTPADVATGLKTLSHIQPQTPNFKSLCV